MFDFYFFYENVQLQLWMFTKLYERVLENPSAVTS